MKHVPVIKELKRALLATHIKLSKLENYAR